MHAAGGLEPVVAGGDGLLLQKPPELVGLNALLANAHQQLEPLVQGHPGHGPREVLGGGNGGRRGGGIGSRGRVGGDLGSGGGVGRRGSVGVDLGSGGGVGRRGRVHGCGGGGGGGSRVQRWRLEDATVSWLGSRNPVVVQLQQQIY